MNLQIDNTITLGNLLSLLASLGAIAVATWRIVARLGRMEMKINLLWRWFAKEHKIDAGENDD